MRDESSRSDLKRVSIQLTLLYCSCISYAKREREIGRKKLQFENLESKPSNQECAKCNKVKHGDKTETTTLLKQKRKKE